MSGARIRFFENEQLMRIEFAPKHSRYGAIDFYEDGKHVRTEFLPTHLAHGQICFINNFEHVRTEYAPTHADHGQINFFENNELVRREFAPTHPWHGHICFFENDKLVRTENLRKRQAQEAQACHGSRGAKMRRTESRELAGGCSMQIIYSPLRIVYYDKDDFDKK